MFASSIISLRMEGAACGSELKGEQREWDMLLTFMTLKINQ
jgi:hypothetical protein